MLSKSYIQLEINSMTLAVKRHHSCIVTEENIDFNTSALVSANLYLEALTRVSLDAVKTPEEMRDLDELLTELKANYTEKLSLFDKKPLFS